MDNSLRLAVITVLLAVSTLSAATLYVSPGSPNPTPPYSSWATAARTIQDAVNAAEPTGALVLVADGVYATGGVGSKGRVVVNKPMTLRSVNGPQFAVIDGGGMVPCAFLADGASLSGFTLTQGGVANYSGGGGAGVCCASPNAVLTNCTLAGNRVTGGGGGGAYGGTLYNCALTGNWAEMAGGGAYGSTLYNCTLTGNGAYDDGGGAEYCTLYNCTLVGNHCAMHGGGASGSTLYDCTLTGNAAKQGGGACWSTLYNCTLTGNSGGTGFGSYLGGAYSCMLYNCIVYYDTESLNYTSSTLNYCCTTPDPGGIGNITSAPLFVDYGGGNLRLQTNSPCINAGTNAYAATPTDLAGLPRIAGGTVDIGAYEFQAAFSGWLQQYGLPTDGSADFADADADRMNNWQEWACNTCPTNPLSVLCLLSATPDRTNVAVSWRSAAGRDYVLERKVALDSSFTPLATNIPGRAGTTTYTDTNATGAGPFLYRVGIRCP